MWLPQQESLPSPCHPNDPKVWYFRALLSRRFHQIQQTTQCGVRISAPGRCLPRSLCEVLVSFCHFLLCSEPCACGCLSLPGTSALWEEVFCVGMTGLFKLHKWVEGFLLWFSYWLSLGQGSQREILSGSSLVKKSSLDVLSESQIPNLCPAIRSLNTRRGWVGSYPVFYLFFFRLYNIFPWQTLEDLVPILFVFFFRIQVHYVSANTVWFLSFCMKTLIP